MDNQHRQISGYRDLTQRDIGKINELKDTEARLNELLAEMRLSPDTNKRSVAIASTHIETAFMYLIKAVAKPNPVEAKP